jgi:hypothetical protein
VNRGGDGTREYSPTESSKGQLAIEHFTPENRLTAPDFNIPRLPPIFRAHEAADSVGFVPDIAGKSSDCTGK